MANAKKPLKAAVLALCFVGVGCVAQYRNHGYVPSESDLAEVIVGVDSRETVAETLGAPTAGGVLDESGYYYVRSRHRTVGPSRPTEIERELVAVTFDSQGIVANIARYGLEDGQVVVLSRRVTDNGLANVTLIRQLLGNFGNFNAGAVL